MQGKNKQASCENLSQLAPTPKILAHDFLWLSWAQSLPPPQPVLFTRRKGHSPEVQHLPETLRVFQPRSSETEMSNTPVLQSLLRRPPTPPSCWPGSLATQVSVLHRGVAWKKEPCPTYYLAQDRMQQGLESRQPPAKCSHDSFSWPPGSSISPRSIHCHLSYGLWEL